MFITLAPSIFPMAISNCPIRAAVEVLTIAGKPVATASMVVPTSVRPRAVEMAIPPALSVNETPATR